MATYGDLQARIADEIVRSDLTTQIQNAILTSVLEFDRERWYFNETAFNTSTVIGQREYTSTNITNTLQIDTIKMTIVAGTVYDLQPRSYEEIEVLTSGSTAVDSGQPTFYAYFNQQISLFPIPDSAAYTFRVVGAKKLTELASASDSNAWTNDAEPMIRARAKWHLYTHVIKDAAQANLMNDTFLQNYTALRALTTDRGTRGRLKATRF